MQLKILKLIIKVLFILTILIMITSLILISISNYYSDGYITQDLKPVFVKMKGFKCISFFSTYYILSHSASFICIFTQHNENYYNWIQLQIGVIFGEILTPILIFITTLLIFLIIGLQWKIKNNNFWDAIQNCEIINNYYIH